ncbi:MAG TPA: sigma-54 dependent transcriptional regulator [Bacteroidales bacterium]|jgi:DNA-binding NtrC family response regulator|nr:sigma-54 dependent transcriptional regulator [Bacteroidales bacterium]
MSAALIFVVEDDTWYADLLEYNLKLNPDYEVEKFSTAEDCFKNLYKMPMAITLDFSLPGCTGGEALAKIKKKNPSIPVIMISGQEDITTAIDLLKEGAYDYIVKNDDAPKRLWRALTNIQENHQLREENKNLKEAVTEKYAFSNLIIGQCPPIKAVFALMQKALNNNISVSVYGETGTGKDLIAKALHYNSNRANNPFVAINVSAIPADLIESELFGHEKGAFTGAIAQRTGKFEEANNGTLFLDEISEMDLNMQSKMLRVLQEREIIRVGSNKVVKIDVRIITASNKDLAALVKEGSFRMDLYYRLMGLPINLPPLRERGSDILLLANYFVKMFCKENRMPLKTLSSQAQKKILSYRFPGNIRELKSIIELSVILSEGDTIMPDDLQIQSAQETSNIFDQELTMEEYNVKILAHFLKLYNKNAIQVANKLDISRATVYRMISKYNL